MGSDPADQSSGKWHLMDCLIRSRMLQEVTEKERVMGSSFLSDWSALVGSVCAARNFQILADTGRIQVDGNGSWIAGNGLDLTKAELASVLVNEVLPLSQLQVKEGIAILFPTKELGSICLSLSINDPELLHPSQKLSCIAAIKLRRQVLSVPSIVNDDALRNIGKRIVSCLDTV